MSRANSSTTSASKRLVGGFGPDQPVGGVVQDSLEYREIFRLIVHDQDIDGLIAKADAGAAAAGRGCASGSDWTIASGCKVVLMGTSSFVSWRLQNRPINNFPVLRTSGLPRQGS